MFSLLFLPLCTGKVKVTRRRVAPNPTAAPGAAATPLPDSSTTVLATKVPRWEVTRNLRTTNTQHTNHGSPAAGARRVPGADPGSALTTRGSTRRRVTTTETTGMSARAPTSERVTAMSETIPATAGIGGEQSEKFFPLDWEQGAPPRVGFAA